MLVKKWIQGMLPVFGEPILPGDFVKVRQLTMNMGDGFEADEIGNTYLGARGQVIQIDPLNDADEALYLVRFGDHGEFYFNGDELQRLG